MSTFRIATLTLLFSAVTATFSYGQQSQAVLPPAANGKATDMAYRMVIANGSYITVAYVPTRDVSEQTVAELQAKAKAESDEANKRAGPVLLPIETGIGLASIRPAASEETPASISQRVTVIMKNGVRVSGTQIRLSDIHVVVRTDDNTDFEIARSEIAAIARQR
jgi:hypothetical protein